MIPARRVERRTGETFATRDVRKQWLVQKARRANENVRNVGGALSGLHVPATISEPRRDDLLVETDESGEATIARDHLAIGPDLGRRRIFARPVVVGLEGKLALT